MTPAEILSRMDVLADLSAALLGVSVTLVALIPAFVEVARTKVPDFLTGQQKQQSLRRALRLLMHTIWIFGAAEIGCLLTFVFPAPQLLYAVGSLFAVGLVALLVAGVQAAKIAISVI